MNDILQVILYFFEVLEYELPPGDLPFSITELKDLNFPASLAIMKRLFPQLLEDAPIASPMEEYPTQPHLGLRVFTPEECSILNKKCRGFLHSLEQLGVLNSISREQVIEEILQLNPFDITLSRLKWITLSILSEQADKVATACVERLVFNIQPKAMH